ncbi:hypothetical protein SETIT_3G297500v2 [Setaria italica]|uniref:Uncharacterized protein n=1 Tax=Setaria italica TaxID=4555 RepID=A0A368QK90_SETIT|nr:hypothetical protein SETIT_3G297500v2 [Setaria italica]
MTCAARSTHSAATHTPVAPRRRRRSANTSSTSAVATWAPDAASVSPCRVLPPRWGPAVEVWRASASAVRRNTRSRVARSARCGHGERKRKARLAGRERGVGGGERAVVESHLMRVEWDVIAVVVGVGGLATCQGDEVAVAAWGIAHWREERVPAGAGPRQRSGSPPAPVPGRGAVPAGAGPGQRSGPRRRRSRAEERVPTGADLGRRERGDGEVEQREVRAGGAGGRCGRVAALIGENSSSEAGGEDGEEEEVESKLKEGDALGCLAASWPTGRKLKEEWPWELQIP